MSIKNVTIVLGITLFIISCNTVVKENLDGQLSVSAEESAVAIESKTIDKELLYGSWIDHSEAILNFSINPDGSAQSDNMESLLYKSWKLNNDMITFSVESIGNHTSSTEKESYSIESLTQSKMVLKDRAGVLYTYTKKK